MAKVKVVLPEELENIVQNDSKLLDLIKQAGRTRKRLSKRLHGVT
jgi:hypothetical protein